MSQVRSLNPRQAMRSPPWRMSYEEFLDWDGENQHVEWVDGKVVPMPPITGEHNDVGNGGMAVGTTANRSGAARVGTGLARDHHSVRPYDPSDCMHVISSAPNPR